MKGRKNPQAESKLTNYKDLLKRLRMEFRRSERYTRPLSLARISIDMPEQGQSKISLDARKKILKEMGEIFGEHCRRMDVVGFYGKKELAVLLPETGLSDAFAVASRLKEEVANHGFSEFSEGITVSAGTANYPRNAATVYNLIRQANKALKLAKNAGPNQVHGPQATG